MNEGGGNTIASKNELACLSRVFLRSMFAGMTRVIEAEQCSLFLYDHQTAELVLEYFYGRAGLCRGFRRGVDDGVAGAVLRNQNPVLVEDINTDARFTVRKSGRYRTGSFICAPLYIANDIFGIFNFSDKSGCRRFCERDFQFVTASRRYAAMIIEDLFEFSRQRRENYLLRREKEMTEKFAAIGAMAAGLMARIKAPLTQLKTQADELCGMCSSETSKRYLGEIREGLERIEKLSDPLAEVSPGISSGRMYIGVNRLLDEAIEVLTASLGKDIRVIRRYGHDLPLIPDRGLEHVFVNIIKNAFEAMPQGGELEIITDRDGDGVRIDFSDTGMGIPVNCRERIFEPFFTTKEFKGTGLGLAISKEIIGMCGGAIDVKSLPGKGSRFSVFIPVQG